MSNTFGKRFRLTSFGESHGIALGGVVDGCPPGIELSIEKIQQELDRRRPGQDQFSTLRNEADKVEILSGMFEGKTTGMPIGFIIRNSDHKPEDYDDLKNLYRLSHADYTWHRKYGVRDYRGGGRSSAREHVSRVVGGAIARQILETKGIEIAAYTSQIGNISLDKSYTELDLKTIEQSPVRCPDKDLAEKMLAFLNKVKGDGDTVGGAVTCIIKNVPIGLGEPVFDRLQAQLAFAMMSINAAKGFEYGKGFAAATMKGSEHNDEFISDNGTIRTKTNHSGGIQGGISNGEDIFFKVAFKPVATIFKEQKTTDISGAEVVMTARGRHDVCVVPRAVPVVEAMAAMAILDAML
ncbi:MAG: chorismate synthase [Prevotellaceae bacterium]|jgi:chorismate synthase|nr:chorismate synthase [Prevotellaceae bacterium]